MVNDSHSYSPNYEGIVQRVGLLCVEVCVSTSSCLEVALSTIAIDDSKFIIENDGDNSSSR